MLTLGINYSQMHDSSACIVREGELLFAVAEERISRLKHDAGFPKNAIRACLDFAKVRAEQLDEVCFGWQTAGPVFRHDLKCYATGKMPLTYVNGLNSTLHFLSMCTPLAPMHTRDLTIPPLWSWTAAARGKRRQSGTDTMGGSTPW